MIFKMIFKNNWGHYKYEIQHKRTVKHMDRKRRKWIGLKETAKGLKV